MDKKQNPTATPSCSEVNRFSELPDGVTYHILSFLTISDMARFSCVSKRCTRLYMSTPTLKFQGFSRSSVSTFIKSLALLSALHSFMCRRGDDKIHTFTFRDLSNDLYCRVIDWVYYARKCNVEVLDLELNIVSVARLFETILVCGTLKSLSLEMGYMYRFLTLPSSACFSNIEYLKLKMFHVVDEGFFRWISSCCKCIKELHLEKIEGIKHLAIESSSLRSFTFVNRLQLDSLQICISAENLEDVVIDWGCNDCKKVLNISAPKVRYMKWTGNLSNDQKFGEFNLLEKAELHLRPGEDEVNIPSEFLISICKVKVLIMKEETVKALFENGSMPATLDNVHHLQMHVTNIFDDLVPAMVSLFKRLPNLSTLYITSEPISIFPRTKSSGYDVAYWKSLNLAFINKLEEVTIELPYGSNGIELAWYILDYTQSLKKMVIVHSPEQSCFKRKVLKRKKISSVKVVFQEDQGRGTNEQIDRRRRIVK